MTMAIRLFDPLFTTLDIVVWNLYLTFSGIIDIFDWIPSWTILSRLLPNISLDQILFGSSLLSFIR